MSVKKVVICLVIFGVASYVLFIIASDVYVHYRNKNKLEIICKYNTSCLQFCCKNCTDDHLNITHLEKFNSEYVSLEGKPCVEGYYETGNWSFKENGYAIDSYFDVHAWNEYCIDYKNSSHLLYICFEDPHAKTRIRQSYPYLMLSSVPFLIITFFVYGCINELRNLHGKCLMSYVFSLTTLYSSNSAIELFHSELAYNRIYTCKFLGYLFLLSILMSFLWLNVMCYDIYTTFSRSGAKAESIRQFILYCLYAFGLPLIIVASIFFLNEYEIIPEDYRSGIGQYTCSVLHKDNLLFLYIYFPIIITLTINSIFYSITAHKIYKVQKETAICQTGDSARHTKAKTERYRFYLYLRLFTIMGIFWIIEIISWLAEKFILSYIASLVTCLQGFMIFVMFVWKTKVQKALTRKYSSISNNLSKKAQGASKSRSQSSTDTTNISMTKLSTNIRLSKK